MRCKLVTVDMGNVCYVDARTGAQEAEMKKILFFLMVLLISVFTACDNVSNNPAVVDKETTEVTETKPSIIGKWVL